MELKRKHFLLLSLLSGLLLFAAWPVSPFTFLIFIAFVPLLLIAEYSRKRTAFFGWLYLGLLVWNTGTTWWTCNSTIPGGIAAILANSLLMSIPWIGFYNVKKRMGRVAGYFSFVLFWMTFEFIHLNWELSWPWLTLGNVFATHPNWVQWYEYTGTSGGSLWVLLVNMSVFLLLKNYLQQKPVNRQPIFALLLLLVLPFSLSYLIAGHITGRVAGINRETPSKNIVLVQPNIDPWDEKFMAGSEEAQLQKLMKLSRSQIDSNTVLLVWPETAIPVAINEDSIKNSYFIAGVWDFLKQYPSVNLLTGMEGFRIYDAAHKTTSSSKISKSTHYADSYNSAVMMDSADDLVYHKSKFVPGAETMPSFLHILDKWFEKFGGTTSGYAGQQERTVLTTFNKSYAVAPSVCYESIYGEFMAKYIRKGANVIVIITNDGWWGNTAGYRQHESYARLRAIETRRWVARSANTGITCFIDPAGTVINPQPWDKATAIKMNIPIENLPLTFFVKYGDIISRVIIVLAIAMICWNLFFIITKKRTLG